MKQMTCFSHAFSKQESGQCGFRRQQHTRNEGHPKSALSPTAFPDGHQFASWFSQPLGKWKRHFGLDLL